MTHKEKILATLKKSAPNRVSVTTLASRTKTPVESVAKRIYDLRTIDGVNIETATRVGVYGAKTTSYRYLG